MKTTTSTTPKGTLVENGGGSYTYTFGTNLSTATFLVPIDGVSLVGYDRTLTHRVSVYMGGHNGATGEGDFDFVPNGAAVTATRNIVVTATCKKCHGPEFAGHGGDRVTVEGCNGCHSPNSAMVNSAANGGTTESIEMAVMIHKIHAGRELASSAGPDGQFFDNPNTVADETADNYSAYAYTVGSLSATWRTAAFPAVLANCQACHTGGGVNVDNWKTVPSRAACGSCHDTINWTTGVGHAGGVAPSDDVLHRLPSRLGHRFRQIRRRRARLDQEGYPQHSGVQHRPDDQHSREGILRQRREPGGQHRAHRFGDRSRHRPGFRGAGWVKLKDASPWSAPKGPIATCPGTACSRSASIYVTGPRAQRIPVLTYTARAKVTSGSAGTWDLHNATVRNLGLLVDGGMPMLEYNDAAVYEGYGADELISGAITVTYVNSFFADNTAATPTEVAAWLNANSTFHDRAIAYVDEARAGSTNAGRLSIRSRGILQKGITGAVAKVTAQRSIAIVGTGPAGMFPLSSSGLSAFGGAGGAGGGRIMTTVANTDPKADFTDGTAIRYTLDPVDDLVPGTYVINVEYGDAGRGPGNPAEPPYVNYRTPSVAVATFQVKQAAVEKPIADGCNACHWSMRVPASCSTIRATTSPSRKMPSISAVAATTTLPARTRRSHRPR